MTTSRLVRGVGTALVILALVLQGTTGVLAGTTGSITGTVVDSSTNQPIAAARVTATSPSQSVSTTTDTSGRYTFASLNPDTYTLTVAASSNHDAYSVSGITIQADQNLTVTLPQPRRLQQIGSVTSRSASALVRPGTVADVYSINATTQDKASQLGGGGTLNSAWSAITAVPGVYVQPGQNGYIGAGPTLSIRGGDYDQIGYELDGVPVNRSFDNYPSGSLSSLGQQEVQVYTGSPPANAESEAISGYINQVIRTGTAPPYRSLDLAVGSPSLYNRLAFEAGGANPSRTFSYYLGLGLYNQNARYADQYNGASLQQNFGFPLAACPGGTGPGLNNANFPGCYSPGGADYTNGGTTPAYVLGPPNSWLQSRTEARDTIVNLHFGIPTKSGGRDDIQALLDINHLANNGYSSPNDFGGYNYLNSLGVADNWPDGLQTVLPYGSVLPPTYTGGGVSTYWFPFSPQPGRPVNSPIPDNTQDQFVNNQGIGKIQYQKNFGTNAFARIYAYSYYSDWLNYGPNSFNGNFNAFDVPDYELNSHTRGVSLQLSDQLSTKHLLSLLGSYTTATSLRYNNSGFFGGSTNFAYLVNGNDPYSGVCYTIAGTAVPGCNFSGLPFQTATLRQGVNGTVAVPATGTTCGGGPCQYVVVAGGPSATYNTVKPDFVSASISDQYQPNARLSLNFGVRYDQFKFTGADTTNSGARTLFYNAYNLAHPTAPIFNPGAGQIFTYDEWQPRFGMTYSFNPSTVWRLSYGRYAQPPNTAFVQYNYLQPNSVTGLVRFAPFGLPTTPGHPVTPEVSNNYDSSIEHAFPGGLSLKVTPFLRSTQGQIQQFFLNQKTNFVSGLNVGHQRSQGVELEVDKGDFARDGFSGRLTFTYTNSYIRYDRVNGISVVDGINQAISNFNSFTAAGGGSPCYTVATSTTPGAPAACAPGTVANPYFNASPQPLLDPNGNYPTFSLFPGGLGTTAVTYGSPYVATLLLQYKKGPWSITPAVQFVAGTRFGNPQSWPGIVPNACTGVLPGTPAGDPRYNFGAPPGGGSPYDATTCGGTVNGLAMTIPDPYTGKNDALGGFVEPNFLQLNLQASYTVNPRLTLVATFANVYQNCWGGSKVGFRVSGACGYGLVYGEGNGVVPVGNFYNPGDALQPFLTLPYGPTFGGVANPSNGTGQPVNGFPFNFFVEARLKI